LSLSFNIVFMLQISSSGNSEGLPLLGLFFNPSKPSFSYHFNQAQTHVLFL
jgi:hypothetical protein